MNARTVGLALSFALAAGCAPTQVSSGASSPSNAAALTGSTSGDPLAQIYDDHAMLSSSGAVTATWGGTYGDTLGYSLPDAGANILQAFIDEDDGLGLPAGAYTEMSLFKLHKTADQLGVLNVVLGDDSPAVRIIRKDVGSDTTSSTWVNDAPYDYGSVYTEADYAILVAPGGTQSGDGTFSYAGLRFVLETD